jgi:UDP-2-acetamido-2,6-beta-L-arabino-hexul-4-ose reductase
MNILVTGSKGMMGTALTNNLKNIRDNKNLTRPNIKVDKVYEYDMDSTIEELDEYCRDVDFVFHLAGVNRPKDKEEFMSGNFGTSSILLETLKKNNSKATVMLASSIQASLTGRFEGSDYGKSKLAGEELFFKYSKENDVKVAVYRFPNVMGHSRPKYNSAVSTFCWAVANGEEFTINDRNTELELLYIDDLVEGMFDLLEGKEQHCDYDGLNPILNGNGKYCHVPITYKVTLGEIADLLESFKTQQETLMVPSIPDGSFSKKLYSLYLTYLPKDKFAFDIKMNTDDRGVFAELMKTADHGQVSVNINRPGYTKGQHWHNSKWEIFMVVSGHGLIQERKIGTDPSTGKEYDVVEYEVSGDKIQAVLMIPGWTHNLINLSDTEDLVTVIWANETFDSEHPDTFRELV